MDPNGPTARIWRRGTIQAWCSWRAIPTSARRQHSGRRGLHAQAHTRESTGVPRRRPPARESHGGTGTLLTGSGKIELARRGTRGLTNGSGGASAQRRDDWVAIGADRHGRASTPPLTWRPRPADRGIIPAHAVKEARDHFDQPFYHGHSLHALPPSPTGGDLIKCERSELAQARGRAASGRSGGTPVLGRAQA